MTQLHANVRYSGVERLHLDSFTSQELHKTVARCMDRLKERTGDLFEVEVHLRAKRQLGEDERYTATVDLAFPGGRLVASDEEWYLINAVKGAFGRIEDQLEQSSLEF